MNTILLLSAVIPYSIGLLLWFPSIVRGIRNTDGAVLWLCAAIVAMFIGQARFFSIAQSGVRLGELTTSAYAQIFWMVLAFLIIAKLFLRHNISSDAWRLPVVALFLYSFWGMVGSGFSPAPLLSVYKAALVAMDALIVLIALSVLKNKARPDILLDLIYFMISVVVVAAALGGILYPEMAFQDIYGGFRSVLHGTIIWIHFNELGLLSAILVIVSVRRAFSDLSVLERFFWAAQAWLGVIVLFNATARTSIASLFIALFALSFLIRRLRPILIVLVVVGIVGGSATWVNRTKVEFGGGDTEAYLRRGSTDEEIKSLSGRIPLWGIGFKMVKDSPIIGHGFDAGARIVGEKYGLPFATNMHSGHMQVLVNSGWPGYILWLLFVLPVAWGLFSRLITRKYITTSIEWGLHVECTLVMFVIFFRTFLGSILVTHHFSFMVYCGLIVYLYLMGNRKTDEVESSEDNKSQGARSSILRARRIAN